MAKFHGEIGYGLETEIRAGVWDTVITEKSYFGDVLKNTRQLRENGEVNPDITVQNSISIVADAYANEHFFAMKYVMWQGVRWDVVDVSVEPPRLVLRLGGVYHGPLPIPAPDAP